MRGAARKGGPYRDKACPDTAVDGWREGACQAAETVKAVSTVAGRAGGPARSSCEASAGRGGGGAKGPGHPWCVRSINRERVSGRSWMDRLKPSGCACVRGSGGQDDRSPVTRDCHAGICGSRRVRPPPATQHRRILGGEDCRIRPPPSTRAPTSGWRSPSPCSSTGWRREGRRARTGRRIA